MSKFVAQQRCNGDGAVWYMPHLGPRGGGLVGGEEPAEDGQLQFAHVGSNRRYVKVVECNADEMKSHVLAGTAPAQLPISPDGFLVTRPTLASPTGFVVSAELMNAMALQQQQFISIPPLTPGAYGLSPFTLSSMVSGSGSEDKRLLAGLQLLSPRQQQLLAKQQLLSHLHHEQQQQQLKQQQLMEQQRVKGQQLVEQRRLKEQQLKQIQKIIQEQQEQKQRRQTQQKARQKEQATVVLVRGLPPGATIADLIAFFNTFPDVSAKSVQLRRQTVGDKQTPFALVTFQNHVEAERAVVEKGQTLFGQRPVQLSFCT